MLKNTFNLDKLNTQVGTQVYVIPNLKQTNYLLIPGNLQKIWSITISWFVLANYIHVCHRNDPELSRCILKSIEQLKPKLRDGISEINVPSLEPFVIPEMVLTGGNQQTYYRGIARNVKVYGASNFDITKLK